jgi:fructose-1,6-bisphosphatase
LGALFSNRQQNANVNSQYSNEALYFNGYSIDKHGNIRLPYLGDINVLGYTTTEVREKIDEEFGNTLSSKDKRDLASLIYYPVEKLEFAGKEEENLVDWYNVNLHRLYKLQKEYLLNIHGQKFVKFYRKILLM